MPSRTDKLFGQ